MDAEKWGRKVGPEIPLSRHSNRNNTGYIKLMGHRELKRVPLDFDWPLHKLWNGYLNPHYKSCQACDGCGNALAMEYLNNIVHLLMVAGSNSTQKRIHPWLAALPMAPSAPPSPDMAELTTGLAERAPSVFGHDSCDRWSACQKIIAAAGLDPEKWGICQTCNGDGLEQASKDLYEA